MTHEKRIEVRWRDVDALRHVNNSVYATYLEECRDEWADLVLGPVADPWDFVLAHVAIDFRNEVRQEDDAVIVRRRSPGSARRASGCARRSGSSTARSRPRPSR